MTLPVPIKRKAPRFKREWAAPLASLSAVLSCSPSTPQGHAAESPVPYEATLVATGFTRPRGPAVPPLVVVVREGQSFAELVDREALHESRFGPTDWSRKALVWVTGRDDGGLDRQPSRVTAHRSDRRLSLTVTLAPISGAQALDVVTRPWGMVQIDAGALATGAALSVTVDGELSQAPEFLTH